MSSSKSKTSPLQSTRQMLDELDTLMERMLALPVGDVEDLPPLPRDLPAVPTMKALTHTPSVDLAKVPALDDDWPAEPDEKAFLERVDSILADPKAPPRTAVPSAPLAGPRMDSARSSPAPHFAAEKVVKAPAQEKEPAPAPVRPAPKVHPAPTFTRPVAEVTSHPAAPVDLKRYAVLPLLWVDRAFDACASVLGPLGRKIHGDRGRNVLGIVGLVCLGLAGAWLVFDQFAGR